MNASIVSVDSQVRKAHVAIVSAAESKEKEDAELKKQQKREKKVCYVLFVNDIRKKGGKMLSFIATTLFFYLFFYL